MPNTYDSIRAHFDAVRFDAMLTKKKEVLQTAAQRKATQHEQDVALLRASWAEMDQVALERLGAASRSRGELADDAVLGAARMGVELTGGTAGLIGEVSNVATAIAQAPVNLTLAALGRTSGAKNGGTAGVLLADRLKAQEARQRLLGELSRATASGGAYFGDRMSDISKANAELVAQETARDAEQNLLEAEGKKFEGGNAFWAGATRIAKNVGDGAANTIANPTALFDVTTSQLPTLGIGIASRAAVNTRAMALKAAQEVRKDGLSGAAARQAMPELIENYTAQAARRNLAAGVGLTEAGGAYQGGVHEILDTPIEALVQQFPQIQEALDAGIDPETIKLELASNTGLRAAMIQGPVAALTSRIAAGFATDPLGIHRIAAKKGARNALKQYVGDIAKEGVEEGIQGGSGALAGNLARQSMGAENEDLLEGVGEEAGVGIAAGGTMAGVMGSPRAAGKTVAAGGRKAWAIVKERFDKFSEGVEDERQKAVEARLARMEEASTRFKERQEARVADQQAKMTTPAAADPILDEETKAHLGLDESPDLDQVTTLARAARVLETLGAQLPPETRENIAGFVVKTARKLRETNTIIAQRRDAALEEGNEADVQAYNDYLTETQAILADPTVERSFSLFEQLPEEELAKRLEEITVEELTEERVATSPALRAAVEKVKLLSQVAPAKMTKAAAEALFQMPGLTPEERAQAKLALDMKTLEETHDQAKAAVEKTYGTGKTQDVVREEIQEKGLTLDGGRKLRSLKDYVNSVSSAAARGNSHLMANRMADLLRWAEHATAKARMFNNAAVRHAALVASLPQGEQAPKRVVEDADGKAFPDWFVRTDNPASVGAIEAIHVDGDAIIQTYNQLAARFPQAVQAAVELTGRTMPVRMALLGKPSWDQAGAKEVPARLPKDEKAQRKAVKEKGEGQPAKAAPAPTSAPPSSAPAAAKTASDPTATEAYRAQREALMADWRAVSSPAAKEAIAAAIRDLDVAHNKPTAPAAAPQAKQETPKAAPKKPAAAPAPEAEAVVEEAPEAVVEDAPAVEETPSADDVIPVAASEIVEETKKAKKARPEARTLQEQMADLRSQLATAPESEATAIVDQILETEAQLREAPAAEAVAEDETGEEGEGALANPEVPNTLATRYAALRDKLSDTVAGMNQFLRGFILNKRSRSIFLRYRDPMRELKTAILEAYKSGDLNKVKELFTEDQRFFDLEPGDVAALYMLFHKAAPELQQILNQNLGKDKGTFRRFGEDPAREWSHQNRKTLHVLMEPDAEGKYKYHPLIAQAMVTAGLHWAIRTINNPVSVSVEEFLRLFPNGAPAEMIKMFREGHYYVQPMRELARDIGELLGVAANSKAPVNFSDGMLKQLAADVMVALEDAGIIRVESGVHPDSNAQMNFIQFNKEPETNWTDPDAPRSLQSIRDSFSRASVLTRLLDPDHRDMPLIGKPLEKGRSTSRKTRVKNSKREQQAIETLNNLGLTLNMSFLDFIGKFEKKDFLRMQGFLEKDELSTLNAGHRITEAGKSQGLLYAYEGLEELVSMMRAYAAANGMELKDVPVYHAWEYVSNKRLMPKGLNPQALKLVREILTANHATIDITDPVQEAGLMLAIAQALGVKTEQKYNVNAIAEVLSALTSEKYAPILEMIDELETLEEGSAPQEEITALTRQIASAVAVLEDAAGGERMPTRQLHALQTYARYTRAKQNVLEGDASAKTFQHALAFELDGKTDGPINALMHFGLGSGFSEKELRQLRMGGLMINQPDATTLNAQFETGGLNSDLYTETVKNLTSYLPQLFHESLPNWLHGKNRAVLKAMQLAGHIGESATDLRSAAMTGSIGKLLKRSIAKHGLMATVYGAGLGSIVEELVDQFTEKVYADISEVLRDREALSGDLVDVVHTLTVRKNKETGVTTSVRLDEMSLSELKDFKFTRDQLDSISFAFTGTQDQPGFGRLLGAAILKEMEPVVMTFQQLYQVSAAQTQVAKIHFTRAYFTRHAQLVREGKILQQDALSHEEELKILDNIKDQIPRYQTIVAQGNEEGVDVSDKALAGKLFLGRQKGGQNAYERVNSITGRFAMDIDVVNFSDPGVRVAALYTLALGDAAMMVQMFGPGATAMLNVFDGLEVTTTDIKDRSLAVNKAVWEGWMFDALGSVAKSFRKMSLDPNAITESQLVDLAKALTKNDKSSTLFEVLTAFTLPEEQRKIRNVEKPTHAELGEAVVKHMTALVNALEEKSVWIQARKQALSEMHVAVDHMSGGERAFIVDNKVFVGSDAELVALISKRASAIYDERIPKVLAHQETVVFPRPMYTLGQLLADLEGEELQVSYEEEAEQELAIGAVESEQAAVDAPSPIKYNPGLAEKDAELAEKLGLESAKGDEVAPLVQKNGAEIRELLANYTFKNKVAGFVMKQVLALLPDDLVLYAGTREAIASKQNELFGEVDLGNGQTPGVFYDNTLFLTVASPETLAHELLHAALHNALSLYYRHGGRGLTAHQRDAIRAMEALMQEFAGMSVEGMGELTQESMLTAQATLQRHLGKEDIYGAVSEFMAWSLTNVHIARAMQKKQGLPALKALAKKVLSLVRKALGLPNNAQVESFLEQTLGQLHRLARREIDTDAAQLTGMPLFMAMGDGSASSPHNNRLTELAEKFSTILLARARAGRQTTPEEDKQNHDAFIEGALETQSRLEDAGFRFTPQESLLFREIQVAFSSGLPLDPGAMEMLGRVHDAAAEQLTYNDFLPHSEEDQPTDLEIQRAKEMLEELTTPNLVDAKGRSNLLAKFLGVALVTPALSAKLDTLYLPKDTVEKGTLNGLLRTGADALLNTLANKSLKVGPNATQKAIIDTMIDRLVRVEEHAAKTLVPNAFAARVRDIESKVIAGIHDKAQELRERNLDKDVRGNLDKWINAILGGVQAMTNEDAAEAFGESTLSVINTTESRLLPRWTKALFADLIGTTDSKVGLVRLMTRGRHMVSRARQRLRDEAPIMVRKFFKEELSEQTWERMTLLGRLDVQALLGHYSPAQIQEFMLDPGKRALEIHRLEQSLPSSHQATWISKSQSLATWMAEYRNTDDLLPRNARSIAQLSGLNEVVDSETITQVTPIIDRLVTLRAMELSSESDLTLLGNQMRADPAGMEAMLRTLRSLVHDEMAKDSPSGMHINGWKGFLPVSRDPRTTVVVAEDEGAAKLLKMGYRRVADYVADPADVINTRMGYYVLEHAGGLTRYNQGAIQTVEGTVMGVDTLTGKSENPMVQTLVLKREQVSAVITAKRVLRTAGGTSRMLPIFNEAGRIIGWERPLDPAIMRKYLREKPDLAMSIGQWMGRQAEEILAQGLNEQAEDLLLDHWKTGLREGRSAEYVAINLSDVNSIKGAWDSIPRVTQDSLLKKFNGKVMVRKDMVDNAVGYRSASVGDVFTGMGDLPEEVRKAIETAALGLLGKNAYKYLVVGERAWQGVISTAKDWIVVRSGTVALGNGVANQFQLVQMGVPFKTLLPAQARKVQELRSYLGNERRIAHLAIRRRSLADAREIAKIDREIARLTELNKRLSIWPLIEAGELPTITEGLAENDEYTLVADLTGWLEKKVASLPPGLSTAARYAVISKDTALYQGLNRAIQFGDFMAKAVLFDHLVSQGKTEEQALRLVNESFINYNLLGGRGRDYLESMGLLWFMNYKIRILKIIMRTGRENPLAFLLGGTGAELVGEDSLFSSAPPASNLGYSIGLGQLERASEMNVWRQMTGW